MMEQDILTQLYFGKVAPWEKRSGTDPDMDAIRDRIDTATQALEAMLPQEGREQLKRLLSDCQRHFKMSFFAEIECRFLRGGIQVLYSLIHHITCRLEARQALVYQLVSGLTGENGEYNYSKAVHLYPPFFDIFCSPKNYKIASALTATAPIWRPALYARDSRMVTASAPS